MFDITGSIVVYRTPPEYLREAIFSFLNTRLNVRLYVVDDSPDDRLRALCNDARVEYLFNGRNIGFGAAHNLALKTSIHNASYHLVLNPDVYFDPGVLESLFAFAHSRPNIGLLMPKVLNPDGSIQHLCKRL